MVLGSAKEGKHGTMSEDLYSEAPDSSSDCTELSITGWSAFAHVSMEGAMVDSAWKAAAVLPLVALPSKDFSFADAW